MSADQLEALRVQIRAVDRELVALIGRRRDLVIEIGAAIGLAAPQLGVLARVIVLDVARADDEPKPLRLANPEIRWASDKIAEGEEGCLSLPEHYAPVVRPARVRVAYLDYENRARELEAVGLLARCVQHEMDHLDGLLFVDHLSALKRNVILRKLSKAKKLTAEAAD